jgi:hypothetical protein
MIDKNRLKEILIDQMDEVNGIIMDCDVPRELESEIRAGLDG